MASDPGLERAYPYRTPLQTLADVIHPFPAFNRMLGASLSELAAKAAAKGEHHEQYASQH